MHKLWIALGTLSAVLQSAPAVSADQAPAATRGCDACPEMVSIPGGEFTMGTPADDTERDDDELPPRRVTVPPFALAKTEVTVAQWRAFARASGYRSEAERNVLAEGCFTWEPADAAWAWRGGRSWREPGWSQRDDEPVVCISWIDAQAYVRWLEAHSGVTGWRLPSEAEWEYAARAGTTTRRPWPDDESACYHANGSDRSPGPRGRTWSTPHPCRDGHWFASPVGKYRPNPWGLHDMLGNVWEWTQDCYLPYAGAPADGRAHEKPNDCRGRVVRGGAWDDAPSVLRSAERYWMGAVNRNNNVGFRVARTVRP